MMLQKQASILSLSLLILLATALKPTHLPKPLSIEAAQAQTPTAFPLPSAVPSGTTVRVDGSESMAVINQALKQRFEAQYPGTVVNLATQGTDAALKAVLDGSLDLAAVGRPLTAAEKQQGLVEAPLTREKIAIIVGSNNPFQGDLTFEQFAQIFRGEITDWSQVGGAPGPIRFIDRPEFSDTRRALSSYSVFEAAPFQTGPNATQIASDNTAEVISQLGSDGISYTIANQVLDQNTVRIVPMHGTLPTDPRYPYSQPRGYAYKESPNPAVLAFLGYATSAAGQQAIAEARSGEAAAVAAAPVSPAPVSPAPVSPAPTAGSPAPIESPVASPAAPVSPTPAPAAAPQRSGLGWLPWLLLPLGLLGLLLWALKGRRTPSAEIPPASPADTPPAPPLATGTGSAVDQSVAVDRPAPPPSTPPVAPAALDTPPAPATPNSLSGVAAGLGAAGLGAAGLGAAGLAAAGLGALGRDRRSRIVLTPRIGLGSGLDRPAQIDLSQAGYAYWEADDAEKATLRDQGGREFALRIADITGLDPDRLDSATPSRIAQYPCAETDQDRIVPLELDRDYVAEVGYMTENRDWLLLARSTPIRLTAPPVASPIAPSPEPAPQSIPPLTAPSPSPSSIPPVPAAVGAVAAGAALGGLAGLGRRQSRIALASHQPGQVYAQWEAPESERDLLRQQGGRQFGLRLYDVTGMGPNAAGVAVQDYECAETEQGQTLSVLEGDRDYAAEFGYWTPEQQWLSLGRSNIVRVAAPSAPTPTAQTEVSATRFDTGRFDPSRSDASRVETAPNSPDSTTESGAANSPIDLTLTGAAIAGAAVTGAAAAGIARGAAAGPETGAETGPETLASVDDNLPELPDGYSESQLTLLPRDPQWVYAYWDAPDAHKQLLRQQGGQRFALRFYDITDVAVPHQNPHSLQQYECDELARDWYIPVPISDRDYIAELGYVTSDGRWLMLARSNPVRVPPVHPADWYEEQFLTVNWDSDLRGQTLAELGTGQSTAEPISDALLELAEAAEAERVAGSLFGSMQQVPPAAVSSFALASGIGMSGIGMSGVGMSGVGMSGIGMSGVGLSGLMSGVGMSGIGMSGVGLYTTSGLGLLSLSGAGMMSGIGMSGISMSGIGMYTASGIGLYTASGMGMMSGVGMSGIGLGQYSSGMGLSGLMSGAGLLYTTSGIGMSGAGLLYSSSGIGMSGAGLLYSSSGIGMSGIGRIGQYTASGIGMSGAGLLYTTSGMGMSGIGMYTGSGIGMSGAGMYTSSGMGMSGAGIYSMSGVGFSASMPLERPRQFWLVADAELIVYGATEPGATVTIAGRSVQVNPDGTFRLQLSFQDGLIDMPILAVAPDGTQSRSIHMSFVRETPSRVPESQQAGPSGSGLP